MKYDIQQMPLFAGISELLENKFGVRDVTPRQLNSIIDAANTIVAALNTEDKQAMKGAGICAWLGADDQGMSSRYLASLLFPENVSREEVSIPWDADDFGRCHRMLEVTGAADRMAELKPVDATWQKLVANWPELTRHFVAQDYSAFQRLLNTLIKQ